MMRPSVQGVDPPVCCTPGCYCYICKRQLCGFPQCAASWMTYARDSFVDSQGGLLSSRGGGPDTLAQTHWHQSYSFMAIISMASAYLKFSCFRLIELSPFSGHTYFRLEMMSGSSISAICSEQSLSPRPTSH